VEIFDQFRTLAVRAGLGRNLALALAAGTDIPHHVEVTSLEHLLPLDEALALTFHAFSEMLVRESASAIAVGAGASAGHREGQLCFCELVPEVDSVIQSEGAVLGDVAEELGLVLIVEGGTHSIVLGPVFRVHESLVCHVDVLEGGLSLFPELGLDSIRVVFFGHGAVGLPDLHLGGSDVDAQTVVEGPVHQGAGWAQQECQHLHYV
jgi:hypothetical protein